MNTRSAPIPQTGPAGQLVRIAIRKHIAWIDTDVSDLLRQFFAPGVPTFQRGGRRGYQCRRAAERYYQADGKDGIITFAGLVPSIAEHLEQHGYRVQIRDYTDWLVLHRLDRTRLAATEHSPEAQHLLRAVAASPCGQIFVRGRGDVAWAIAAIGSLLPQARILVVASTLRELQSVYRQLVHVADRPVTVDMYEAWRTENRLIVCTANLFTCASGDDWDMVIFCGAETVLAQQPFRRAMGLDDQLRFVIVQAGSRLGPRARLQLAAVCGPEIFRTGDHQKEKIPVQVVFVRSPAMEVPHPDTHLMRKRLGIWHNAARNNMIATLATAIAEGDMRTLEGLGLQSPCGVPCLPQSEERAGVVVLIESTEHAQQLLGRLPGWEIKAGPKNIGAKDAPSRNLPPAGSKTIVTVVYAEQHGIDADIVIRGDGGSQWPLSQVALQPHGKTERDQIVIIDLVAASGGNDRGRLHQRARDYQRHGWKVGNIVPNPASPNGPSLSELGGAMRPK